MTDNNNRQAWLGPQFLQKLANANLAGWQAVNEIIANSIDSWIDFNKPRPVLEINIEVEQSNNLSASSITISDNAQGMDFSALEKAVLGFLDSDKLESKNSSKYLGMFGFGLLGGAFTLGRNLTVVTTKDNKTHLIAKGDVESFAKTRSFEITEEKADSQQKKLFKKSGTRIIIKDLNSKLNNNVMLNYLQQSWRFFLNENEFGKAIKINLIFNDDKEIVRPYKLGQFNDRPVIDETIVPIEFELEWKTQRTNEKNKLIIKGQVGLSAEGGQNALAGGINVYRRGQLIEPTNREFYNWGAMTAKLHGDLHIDLPVTMQKGGFDKQSDGWAKLMEKFGPDSGFWAKYTRWSGKFESNFSKDPDSEEYKTFIAEYKNEFGLTLTREQQKLLSSGGGAGDGGKGTNVDSTPDDDSSDDGSEETKEKKLKYNIKDLEHFSINKEKYIIERTVISDNSRGPWFAMPVGNKINIGINSSAENYKVVTDAFKKIDSNKTAKLLIKSIYLDCIKQFLRGEGFDSDFISEFSNSYWEF